MKRFISLSILILLGLCPVFAQQSKSATALTDEQWQVLTTALENEDWSAAADYSFEYMGKLKNGDTEGALPRLRYDFIFAAAGKATQGKMSQEELKAALKSFIGKEVEMPGRLIADCRGGNERLGAICFNEADRQLSTAATNKSGASIFAFEYIQLQDEFDLARHVGRWAVVSGTIKSIEINPSVLRIWASRIFLDKGRVRLEE